MEKRTEVAASGYIELCAYADWNEFGIVEMKKHWTHIIPDGYDSRITLNGVSATDVVSYIDEENTLYLVKKSNISAILKAYNSKDDTQSMYDFRKTLKTGGVSVADYDPVVTSVQTIDKKGVRTELSIMDYLQRTDEQVVELFERLGIKNEEDAFLYGYTKLQKAVQKIYTTTEYNTKVIGTDVKDKIKAGKGNDTILGGAGNDTIYGGRGNDIVDGGEGNDKLYGQYDNNRFEFNQTSGYDTVYSGKGEDLIYIDGIEKESINYKNSGKNLIINYGEKDSLGNYKNSITISNYLKNPSKSSVKYFQVSEDINKYNLLEEAVLKYNGKSDKRNKIKGSSIKDVIIGGELNDVLLGGGCDDVIYGGNHNDKLYGDSGNDKLYGEQGNDTIYGGSGDDYINGGVGNDKIYGGSGNNDIVFSIGDGKDNIYPDKKGVANIKINGVSSKDLVYDKVGNNLEIKYSKDDKITIVNYFKTKNVEYLTGGGVQTDDDKVNMSEMLVTGEILPNGTYSYNGKDGVGNLINTTNKKSAVVKTGNGKNTVILNSSYGTVLCGDDDDLVYLKGANGFVDVGEGNNFVEVSKSGEISSGTGDDRFEVKSLGILTKISDKGGNDVLVVGENFRKIRFVFDVEVGDDGLIADGIKGLKIIKDSMYKNLKLGKEVNGIEIANYFDGGKVGDGRIERIYSKDGWFMNELEIWRVQQYVGNWLSLNGYDSTSEVFASGDKVAIGKMLEIFDFSKDYWNAPV